jgi:hypothetical protein
VGRVEKERIETSSSWTPSSDFELGFKLHDQAGIEAAGATAARRTFGVRLHRAGYDLRHIREAMGLATLSAAKALCGGEPVDLGRIVARVI